IEGRDFDERDARFVARGPDTQLPGFQVAIVSESYATHYFGGRSPIGRHIGFGINPGAKTPIEIIGVVKDAKYTGVRDDIFRTVSFAYLENDAATSAVVYVRTANRPDSAFASIRQTIQQIDPNMPMYNARTLEAQADQSLLNDRLVATLSSAFGVLATLL